MWGVSPYCLAWGNNTIHGDKETGMLSYGKYESGTGLLNDPMIFSGGSDASCRMVVIQCFYIDIIISHHVSGQEEHDVL